MSAKSSSTNVKSDMKDTHLSSVTIFRGLVISKIKDVKDIEFLHSSGLNNQEVLSLLGKGVLEDPKNTILGEYQSCYKDVKLYNCLRAVKRNLYHLAKSLFIQTGAVIGYDRFDLMFSGEIDFIKLALKHNDYDLIGKILLIVTKNKYARFFFDRNFVIKLIEENISNEAFMLLLITNLRPQIINYVYSHLVSSEEDVRSYTFKLVYAMIKCKVYPSIALNPYNSLDFLPDLISRLIVSMFPNITQTQIASLKSIKVSDTGNLESKCDDITFGYVKEAMGILNKTPKERGYDIDTKSTS